MWNLLIVFDATMRTTLFQAVLNDQTESTVWYYNEDYIIIYYLYVNYLWKKTLPFDKESLVSWIQGDWNQKIHKKTKSIMFNYWKTYVKKCGFGSNSITVH